MKAPDSTKHEPLSTESSESGLQNTLPQFALSDEQRAKAAELREQKWKLLPEIVKTRGLLKQHIHSFNNFIEVRGAFIIF